MAAWVRGAYVPGMIALMRLALAGRPTADSLGEFAVGSIIDRAAFPSCTSVECETPGALAGRPGLYTVMLCGRRVRLVSFTTTWVSGTQLPDSALTLRGMVSDSDPKLALQLARSGLDRSLTEAGWSRPQLDPGLNDGSLATSTTYRHADSRERVVFTHLGVNGAMVVADLTIATALADCADGL